MARWIDTSMGQSLPATLVGGANQRQVGERTQSSGVRAANELENRPREDQESENVAMRIAYADPPYPGNAKRLYGPTAREVNFPLLIAHLQEFDGWALSSGSKDLRKLAPLCPEGTRFGAWVQGMTFSKPGISPRYAWQPVMYWPARKNQTSMAHLTPVDWVKADATRMRGVAGAKPEAFCFWIFRILGTSRDDEFVDLFPGSGAVTQAWAKFRGQQVLQLESI